MEDLHKKQYLNSGPDCIVSSVTLEPSLEPLAPPGPNNSGMMAVIVNRASGAGRTATFFDRVRQVLPRDARILETRWQDDAIELAHRAYEDGARTIVIAGGDGTINKVINGLFNAAGESAMRDVRIAIIPSGTGSDFRRSLNMSRDPEVAARMVVNGTPKRIDILRVTYTCANGDMAVRYCANVTSFGLGGAVTERANRTSKMLGGRMSFFIATLIASWQYNGKDITLILDGKETFRGPVSHVAIGNGRYCGGGMLICPDAALDDGLLDITLIERVPSIRLMQELPRVYRRGLTGVPQVLNYRCRQVQVHSSEGLPMEIDGEPLGQTPLRISVLPAALSVFRP